MNADQGQCWVPVNTLKGHADKSMVDKVYGKYREGIEHEAAEILSFYGKDFAQVKNGAATPSDEGMAAPWESFGKVVA